jgi:hypothetical protein
MSSASCVEPLLSQGAPDKAEFLRVSHAPWHHFLLNSMQILTQGLQFGAVNQPEPRKDSKESERQQLGDQDLEL